MTGERRTAHLGQLYDFSSGLSKPRSAFGSGYPFLTFKDVFYNIFVPGELGDLVNSTEYERDVCSIKRGDVFLTRTSETMHELGMSCVALQDVDAATFNGFTKRLRPKAAVEIAPEYAGYFFRSDWFRRQITAMASLSTRASLNNEMLGRLQMILPDEIDQRAIGRVLKGLDDKIELNRRMNETLEAMARAIFKSWFVDFDPVRAKARGEQPAGLAPHIAALFPDALVETELGEAPEGWEVKTVGELLELAYGKALKADNRRPGPIPVFGANGQVGWHDETLVAGPGIVVGRKGNPGIVTWVSTDFYAIDTTFYVVDKTETDSMYFLYYALQWQNLPVLSADSAVPGLNRIIAYMNKQIVPHRTIIEAFGAHASVLFARANQGKEESRCLAALRDTLLPKLISGELRVADAERIVGKAT